MTIRTGALLLGLVVGTGCVERGEVLGPEPATTSNPPAALATEVSLGQSHTLAISRGRLYAWGANAAGQLGLGDNEERHVPTAIPSSSRFVSVAAGFDHSCAIDELSDVYCWGQNDRGQLGQGDRTSSPNPLLVDLPAPAAAVSARFSHSCALLKNATLYCWGQNAEGQLGQDDSGVNPDDPSEADGLLPLPVGGAEWIDVATGDGHTCAVRLDGALFCWGRNSSHQLGPDSRIQIRAPIQVDSALDWLDVDAGQQHTFAIKRDGSVYAWGENVARASDEGFPLGIDVDELDVPTLVELERGGTAVVSTSVFHTCSVSDGGELDCWGRNAEGQLGTGDTELRREPTPIATGIATVSTSWFTTCVINVEGTVLCTGKNGQGELGLGHLERPLVLSDVVLEAP